MFLKNKYIFIFISIIIFVIFFGSFFRLYAASNPAACQGVYFAKNLSVGSSGQDVKCLQAMLNKDLDTRIASSGNGSVGRETRYFGFLTKKAIIKFQNKYRNEISQIAGYAIKASGFVGPGTRAQLNALSSKTPVPPVPPVSVLPSETPVEAPVEDPVPPVPPVCGNSSCETGENSQNCARDCARELKSTSNTIILESNKVYDLSNITYRQTADKTVTLKCKNSRNITITGAHLIGKGTYLERVYSPSEIDGNWDIGIALVDCENVTILDFEIENFQTSGIAILRSKNVLIKNGKILGTTDVSAGNGKQFNIFLGDGSENITIENTDISRTAQGIYSTRDCNFINIINNYIHDIPGQHGMYLGQNDNLLIKNNTVDKTNYQGMKIQITHASKNAENILIENNVFRANGIHGILLTVLDSSDYTIKNAIIRNNLIDLTGMPAGSDGIVVSYRNFGSSMQAKVYENTVTGAYRGIRLDCVDAPNDVLIYNNIISNSSVKDFLVGPQCPGMEVSADSFKDKFKFGFASIYSTAFGQIKIFITMLGAYLAAIEDWFKNIF